MPDKNNRSGKLRPGRIAFYYAGFAGLWILVSGIVLTQLIQDPLRLEQVEIVKGLVFVAVTSGLLYLLLAALENRYTSVSGPDTAETGVQRAGSIRRLVFVFLAMLMTIPLLAYAIIYLHGPDIENKAEDSLRAIADLKAKQIRGWLQERSNDAETLSRDPGFVEQVGRLNEAPEEVAENLSGRLEAFRQAYEYTAVRIVDAAGSVLLKTGKPGRQSDYLPAVVQEALRDRQMKSCLLCRDSEGDVHLDFIAPLIHGMDDKPVSAVVLEMNPEKFIIPLVMEWPTSSPSGETLIITRHDSAVMVLNDTSHHDGGTPEMLAENNELVSVMAMLDGSRSGVVRGRDHHGNIVMAAYQSVPGTDWKVVSKMDRTEVMQPLHDLVIWVSLVAFFGVAAVGVSILILWKQQVRLHAYSMQAEKNRMDSVLRYFYDLPFIGMAVLASDTGQLQRFNQRLCDILGYTPDELRGKPWREILQSDERKQFDRELKALEAGHEEGFSLDARLLGKHAALVFASIDIKCIRNDDGDIDHMFATIDDITTLKREERALAESEARLRSLVKTIPDLVWMKDPGHVFIACNRGFERLLGAREDEILGRIDYDFFSTELADRFRGYDADAMQCGMPSINEESLTFAEDGYQGVFEIIKTPVYDAEGKFIGVLGIARDITERKENESRIKRLSRLYATQSHINQAIIHCRDQDDLFRRACELAVKTAGFRMASVFLPDDKSGDFRSAACYGEGSEYLSEIRISTSAEVPEGRGPTGTALREDRAIWSQDFQNDPTTAPWHESARRHGYAAAAALPIHHGGSAIGTFTLYAAETGAFDEQVQRLLIEICEEISYALGNLEHEKQRRRAEERLSLVLEGSNDAPWDWDLTTDQHYYAPQWWHMLGYEVDELPRDSGLWRRLTHPDDLEQVDSAIQRILQPGHDRESVQCRFMHKDGHYVPTLVRGIATRDETGRVVRLTGTIMDISERKRIEEELKEQLEELQRWQDAMLGREERILSLKQEVNELLRQAGLSPRYGLNDQEEIKEE